MNEPAQEGPTGVTDKATQPLQGSTRPSPKATSSVTFLPLKNAMNETRRQIREKKEQRSCPRKGKKKAKKSGKGKKDSHASLGTPKRRFYVDEDQTLREIVKIKDSSGQVLTWGWVAEKFNEHYPNAPRGEQQLNDRYEC